MALDSKIPRKSELTIVGGKFRGVLNNPTAGKYDFTNYAPAGDRFNVAIDLGLPLNPKYLYFFNEFHFSTSIDEDTYLAALDPGFIPTLNLRDSTTKKSIFHQPLRLFRYFESTSVDYFYLGINKNARLIADLQLVIDQVLPVLVGISDIYAQCSFSVYEISDARFISDYQQNILKK